MTDADGDRVVAALDKAGDYILASFPGYLTPERDAALVLIDAALPIARAMAALVAADVTVDVARKALRAVNPNDGDALDQAVGVLRDAICGEDAALAEYRRAIGEPGVDAVSQEA